MGVRWHLVVLICISQITSGAENLSSHLLTIHVSFFVEYLFKSLLCFLLIWLFLVDFFRNSLYILNATLGHTCYKYRLSVCSMSFHFLYIS